MAMTRRKWSINALSVELKKDRALIGRLVSELEPAGKDGRAKLYWMSDVVLAMLERDDLDLTAEKARLAKEQADKHEIENAVRRGELIEAADALDTWGDQIANARAKILAIGHTVAPVVAAETDATACQELIDERAKEALGELSES